MQNYFKSLNTIGRAFRSRKVLTLAVVVLFVLITPVSARADGIDIWWLITRVGGPRQHPAVQVAIVLALMIVNYLLNLAVLGVPAARFLQIKVRTLTKDLIVFTLLAQVADRGSAVAGFLLGLSLMELAGLKGEQGMLDGILLGVCLNFIFAGLAVGSLALWYLMRRWGVKRRRAIAIAVLTAVITNPAWPMMILTFGVRLAQKMAA